MEEAVSGSELQAWVDGSLVPVGAPALAVTDRGFQLGDGVFETIRVRRGIAIDLALHLGRLREGLAALEIPLALDDGSLADGIAATVAANAPADAAVRITVSRGAPVERGLLPAGWRAVTPTVVIQAWPIGGPPPATIARGVRAITSIQRRDPAHPLASVKTTSRADHVLVKLEAERAGVDDALVLTLAGDVAEATTANVAVITRGSTGLELVTPPLSAGILAGATRDWLLSAEGAVAVGLPAREAPLSPAALLGADEAILCSSVAGIVALVALDGRAIGDGRPGPWSARLREAREAWIRQRAGG